ncbi:small EDRK-rich factor 2 isoform X1 [Lagenorhynchus albirostris]|uniref:small EDRK-rich factor 2 isoform X1 n=1 Tax=Lagenorhynchus albirostris TaxID=27610 RepID=UPI0028EF1E29|nr:small EDRK-rich factor 2 isoform X1 [Lagenorhynchus albirostris]
MTRGNQRELARQKNMKKQSDSVKGKRRDDGLSAAARKQSAPSSLPPGTRRSCSRSRKRQTRRRRNPSSFVASCPTLLPFACVPGASPTTLAFSPVVLTGPSTDGIPFALSLQRVPFVLPSPQFCLLGSWPRSCCSLTSHGQSQVSLQSLLVFPCPHLHHESQEGAGAALSAGS